ncbi:MAG: bifunctional UDP-sugar hydrolase/5'-nucleotidase [Alphaproteobacteria bacterium]
MMQGRGLGAFLGAVFLLIAAGSAMAEPVRIVFFHSNDVVALQPKDGRGGIAEFATLLKRERQAAPLSITTLGGDIASPSVLSALTKGAHMIALYQALGTDAAVLGNHEFDFGPEAAAARVKESGFPWLGANVLDRDGKVAIGARATHIVERGGIRIGLFGLLTADTAIVSGPGPDIRFAPFLDTATRMVADLRAQGADIVVALTHQDFADDRRIAREVPGIDLILGGHDHNAMDVIENGVLIHKSGQNAEYLGIVELTVDRRQAADGRKSVAVTPSWRAVPVTGVEPDPLLMGMVRLNDALLDQQLSHVVGIAKTDLDGRQTTVRSRESNLGNAIADAMRAHHAADAALMNGGGIRSDRLYPAGTPITRKDVVTQLPFANLVVLLEVTGADLRAALENGVSQVEHDAGRFPQVSGLSFDFDPAKAPGSRIGTVLVGGKPLDPDGRYRLATNDYMARGGDGYASLASARRLVDATGARLLATVAMDYMAALPTIEPRVEGRIRAAR